MAGRAIFVGGRGAVIGDVSHDPRQPFLGLIEGPAVARGVLLHFERGGGDAAGIGRLARREHHARSEEHTSELQSLMRISYAVFCLKKKKNTREVDKNPYFTTLQKIDNILCEIKKH